jgi:hypothetical protein
MPDIFDTSVAARAEMILYDYNDILGVMTYSNVTNPVAPFAVDLSTFFFRFELCRGKDLLKFYEIQNGEMATGYLSKEGASHETLNIQLMLQDIRTLTTPGKVYSLVQKVIDNDNLKFIHTILTVRRKQ